MQKLYRPVSDVISNCVFKGVKARTQCSQALNIKAIDSHVNVTFETIGKCLTIKIEVIGLSSG